MCGMDSMVPIFSIGGVALWYVGVVVMCGGHVMRLSFQSVMVCSGADVVSMTCFLPSVSVVWYSGVASDGNDVVCLSWSSKRNCLTSFKHF